MLHPEQDPFIGAMEQLTEAERLAQERAIMTQTYFDGLTTDLLQRGVDP